MTPLCQVFPLLLVAPKSFSQAKSNIMYIINQMNSSYVVPLHCKLSQNLQNSTVRWNSRIFSYNSRLNFAIIQGVFTITEQFLSKFQEIMTENSKNLLCMDCNRADLN